MEKNQKRIKTGIIIILIVFVALIGRLFYIQVLCHQEFAEATLLQHELTIEGLDTRGHIFDRNMNLITGGSNRYYYIIKSSEDGKESKAVFEALGAKLVTGKEKKYRIYVTDNYDRDKNRTLKEEYGCYVFRSRSRYASPQPACHLVGYLNDSEKKGVSGLEYMYEEQLESSLDRLVINADAAGNILPGKGPVIKNENSSQPKNNSVVTTIDLNLQKKVESLLCGSAACIVSDAATGEILAMASAPTFDPGNISDYITNESDCLINKALQCGYAPGSVFKLVTAAAALESGRYIAESRFTCEGKAEIEGVSVSCSTAPEGGHGEIDMYEAMAKSCNCYFAKLGQKIGYAEILDMARLLGMGEKVLQGFPEESEGNIPQVSQTGMWDISNISIGQGTIETTPLQINRMISIIANNGKKVVMNVTHNEATASAGFETTDYENMSSESDQIISVSTASALQQMMKAVTTYGTCSGPDWPVRTWAKSGTAEASLRGQPAKHCWLAGFCETGTGQAENVPYSSDIADKTITRYVITVFVENGMSGSATALPIFKEIVNYLSSR